MDRKSDSLYDVWRRIEEEAEQARQTFVRSLDESWAILRELIEAQSAFLREDAGINELLGRTGAPRLASLEDLLEKIAVPLFRQPVEKLRRYRPQEKAYRALEDYGIRLEALARSLPRSLMVSGSERKQVMGTVAGRTLSGSFRTWQHHPKPLPVRALVRDRTNRLTLRRAPLDGAFLLRMAQAYLHVDDCWSIVRNRVLASLLGQPFDASIPEEDYRIWLKEWQQLDGSARSVLAKLDAFVAKTPVELARVLLRAPKPSTAPALNKRTDKLVSCRAYWARQQRAAEASLDTELALVDTIPQMVRVSHEALRELSIEYGDLVAELDEVIGWLEEWRAGNREGMFPPARSPLVSATERTGAWIRAVGDAAGTRIFEVVETVEPRREMPGWRQPWRKLRPLDELQRALGRNGRTRAQEGFSEAEAAHNAILGDIERAREVVSFSLDVLAQDAEAGREIAGEGIDNALMLVQNQRARAADVTPAVEVRLAYSLTAAFEETALALELHRLGFWTHVARRRGRSLAQTVNTLVLAKTKRAGREAMSLASRARQEVLVRLGWVSPPTARMTPVFRRAYVGEVLPLGGRTRNLPLIYGRLFRLAPVEDPRFLVGRDDEMAAMAEAKRLWKQQRSASVLVIGARGSGKTSLLNCACLSVFEGEAILRANFAERMVTAAQVRSFLAARVGCDPADLEEHLNHHPRIIVLEEMERCYRRSTNGFEGVRELLNILLATSQKNLWALSLNQYAFRLLDRAEQISQYFSVRVMAMAVEPNEMRNAILMRHNLSGLRLLFAPPPEAGNRPQSWRGKFGLDRDAEEVFFQSLYQLSGGIFRSAFEMWLSYIERAEGGILYMKYPEKIDSGPITSSLTLEDEFTLLAIGQHGSLTEEDHAAIFECDLAESRRLMQRLLAREILEPDPLMPGLRIRPEAARVVSEALHRRNLG